jgi:hypothetical protein
MLVYIDIAQFRLQLSSLFLQDAYDLYVVAVDLNGLLRIKFDSGEEAAPLNNLLSGCRQGEELCFSARRRNRLLLA